MNHVPVGRWDKGHVIHHEIFVQLLEGRGGTSSTAAYDGSSRLVGEASAGIEHPVKKEVMSPAAPP